MPRPQPPPQKMLFSDASTWKQMFQELIQEEKPKAKWTLQLDKNILPNGMAQGWRQYQQTGIGRFLCSICDRYWVSAQVKILCHLYREPGKSQGQVLMRIFGQRCQKCTRSKFENPEFSMENIQRILENLVSYILRKYYGHGLKKTPSTSNERVHLDGPHDTANCEACALGCHGVCAFANEATPLKSPSSPPTSYSSSSPMSYSSSPKNQSSSPPKSHSSSPPKSHSSSLPMSYSSSLPMSYSSSSPMSYSSSQPMSNSSSPKSHSSSPPKSHSSSPPKSHSSSSPMSYGSSPKSHSSSPPKSHSSSPPKSHSSSSPMSYGSSPKSHSSSPPKSHSSSLPKSYSSLPQTSNTTFENMYAQEHREVHNTGVLAAISLVAFALIRLFLKF
ncbi:receptor-transporting protein 4 [Cricetulus griseus]|uniref:Receptor-transporting protein 4 n=1 Tax=Cricetulus griseus TaxID=10029 RepID=A0A9J7FUJ2_CRIGR|nr:receptor-transporting protein 4 [Cricetulus griseus]